MLAAAVRQPGLAALALGGADRFGHLRLERRLAGGETLAEIAGHAPTTPDAEKKPSLQDIYDAGRKKYDGR